MTPGISNWLTSAPRWIWFFLALAAFNVVTVGFSLFVNHNVVENYRSSIRESQHLSEYTEQFSKLGQLAAALNRPGNDVFGSRDVAREESAFAKAALAFDAHLVEVDGHLHEGGGGQGALFETGVLSTLAPQVDEIRQLRATIGAESEGIFTSFKRGRRDLAGSHMARMDRAYSRLVNVIAEAVQQIEGSERVSLERNLAAVQQLRGFEFVLGGLLLLMIVGATSYGMTLARVWRDKNDAEQARLAAEDMNRARSAFLAQMSHELRTPLASIKSYGEVLREEAAEDGREQEVRDIDVILSSSAHLLKMISDVLDASKLEAGKIELDQMAFDIERDLIRHVADIMRPSAAANGNTLHVSIDGDLGAASADLTRLRQCLLNLTSNAVKFTKAGVVAVSGALAHEDGRRVLKLAVKDSGVGMSEAARAQLFQAFQQADANVNTKFGGTGLGLYITKHFVELMGGAIAVESEQGVGSTFTITIPLLEGREYGGQAASLAA